MRILAVDAGNSRIKWGLHDGEGWRVQGWVATAQVARLAREWARLPPPDVVIVTNVAGSRVARSLAAAGRPLKRRVRFVRSAASQCGVRSSYDDPAQLGADRWAALIGAWHLHRGPCVVVNAGTTMTVDALTTDGVFLGGMIVAGADLMRQALARNTAALRPQRGRFAFFPARTADAIASGALNALAGAIERMQRFMREAGQAAPLTVLSGGAAPPIAPQLNGRIEVVDNLVLEGIVRIAHDSFKGRVRK
ncbi:MAG: type III pantothenate kinase [Betaproteobacteria bacterium]|nr:type III pantothenate kinase [Betaproteobacteria bacterium]